MIDNKQLKELIKHLIYNGIVVNQTDFAEKLGYDKSTISGMTIGKKPISESFANKVSEIFNVQIEWMRTGKGEMLKNNSDSPGLSDDSASGKLIPFYDIEAAAGSEYGMDMTTTTKHSSMIEIGSILKDSELAIRVYGNSMIPNYPAGCVIGLRRYNESFIDPGHVYVLETRENRFLKRLYYNKDKTAIRCVSDNTMIHTDGTMKGEFIYQDFEIPFEDVHKLYRVVGVIKRNIM